MSATLPPLARERQTFGGGSLLARYASFVKLPHTLFALPFAGVGSVLASYTYPHRITAAAVLWILLAFTAARFAAMGFNRIIDRAYDAANPRTRLRELPAGRLTLAQAWVAVLLASLAFVAAAFQLNPLCGWLSLIALAWTFFYSFTKRFTSWSHWVLGSSLGIAPVGAYLAIAAEWSQPAWALPLLAAGVMFWVAGFDIVYALQDIDFDRQRGLRSVPARLGPTQALLVSRVAHALAVSCFAAIAVFRPFPVGLPFSAAVAFMAVLLVYEHYTVRPRGGLDISRIDRAFFFTNVVVSSTFFLLVLLDRIIA